MLCRKEKIIPKADASKIKIYSLSDKFNLQEDSNFFELTFYAILSYD